MWRFSWLVLLVGCGKPPVEAPAELNELVTFMVERFETPDSEEFIAGATALQLQLEGMDLEGDIDDRAFTMAALSEGSLGGMPAHAGFSAEEQIPVAVAAVSAHDLPSQMRIVEETNHVCIESGTTKYYSRVFNDDVAGFVDGSRSTLSTSNEIRKETLIADVWYDVEKEYLQVDIDGTPMMFARSWSPEVYFTDNGNNSFDQTYILEAWIPSGNRTMRFYSMWSSVTLSGLGDDAWSALVRSGIGEGYEYADDYLANCAEELCDEDRDRAYDRP